LKEFKTHSCTCRSKFSNNGEIMSVCDCGFGMGFAAQVLKELYHLPKRAKISDVREGIKEALQELFGEDYKKFLGETPEKSSRTTKCLHN
jgi:hypothetical protein